MVREPIPRVFIASAVLLREIAEILGILNFQLGVLATYHLIITHIRSSRSTTGRLFMLARRKSRLTLTTLFENTVCKSF
jgi:hypothetical protein